MKANIFTSLEDSTADSPEQALIKNLKKNPSYPFRKEADVFELKYLHENLWYGFLLLLASVVGTAVHFSTREEDHSAVAVLAFFSIFFALCMMWSGAFHRRIVVDSQKKEYQYYLHNILLMHGPLEQVSIRLVAYRISKRSVKFALILVGHKLGVIELTRGLNSSELLHCLGRRLSKKLGFKYLDERNVPWRRPVLQITKQSRKILPV